MYCHHETMNDGSFSEASVAKENAKQVGATLRTIEAEISYKAKNNEARPKFTGSYKKKRV